MNCEKVAEQSEPVFGPGGVTEYLILRWVFFANYFKLLVPGGSAVVGFLLEPGDHIFLMIHINRHMVSLQQNVGGGNKKKVRMGVTKRNSSGRWFRSSRAPWTPT